MLIALLQRFPKRSILFAQTANIQLLVDDHPHFVEREGFQYVVAGARLHCFDGGFDGAKRSHHHHRQRGIESLNSL